MKKKILIIKAAAVLVFWAAPVVALATSPRDVTVIPLGETDLATVIVHPGGTVLSFPVKPKKVVLGRSGVFDVEYVANDVAISPLKHAGESQLFVYLLGRRYTFHLQIGVASGHKIVLVRDPKENMVEVYIDD